MFEIIGFYPNLAIRKGFTVSLNYLWFTKKYCNLFGYLLICCYGWLSFVNRAFIDSVSLSTARYGI